MNKKEFFPPRPSANPTIYAYELVASTHRWAMNHLVPLKKSIWNAKFVPAGTVSFFKKKW